MQLTFLGKSTQGGGSPTLYATGSATYVVQGWKVADAPSTVEIPAALLRFCESNIEIDATARPTGRRWRDDDGIDSEVLALDGTPVTAAAVLAQMKIPDH